ncbi:MAG: glutamate formimidoyltransferase, partial [Desulfosarcina sp.]|nr:glutamate formimidoyltransferase [Desulfobacterales bacterium]
MNPIIECVPNFSEGRDRAVVEKIAAPFSSREDVKLLDVKSDADHNRTVVTVLGSPRGIKQAMLDAMHQAISHIDMTRHEGQHPCMGAVDVVPLIPVRDMTMGDAVALSKEMAAEAASRFELPVFLYERSATADHRADLAAIRKGQFEGMNEKLKDPLWSPDYGPGHVHPTAGVTAMGARSPLVAFNVNLGTDQSSIADAIAKKIRYIGGGLRFCKAMGVTLKDRNQVQVSMNMTDFSQSALYQAVELVRIEAKRYGVPVVGSEVVGLVPMQALIDCAVYYMGLENFDMKQV